MMKKVDYDKLQDSLEHIKSVCEEHIDDGCRHCPLGDKNGICQLSNCPKQWSPRHPATDVFRVLG